MNNFSKITDNKSIEFFNNENKQNKICLIDLPMELVVKILENFDHKKLCQVRLINKLLNSYVIRYLSWNLVTYLKDGCKLEGKFNFSKINENKIYCNGTKFLENGDKLIGKFTFEKIPKTIVTLTVKKVFDAGMDKFEANKEITKTKTSIIPEYNSIKVEGEKKYIDGTIEIGEFVSDKIHGFGIKTLINGTKLKGKFFKGYLKDTGKITYPNGVKVKGTFNKEGQLVNGIITCPNGIKVESEVGHIDENFIKGKLTYPDGTSVSGFFKYSDIIEQKNIQVVTF